MREKRVETLKVGIIGAGGIAAPHAQGWQANAPRAQLVALADISPSRAQYLSDRFTGGSARVYTEIDALLANPEIDAVDICLPHDLHTRAILAAARAGKAI